MAGKRLKLRAQPDFVRRLTQAPVLAALEELIWNAFDERARTVEVAFEFNELRGVDAIEIRDDGQGLRYDMAPDAFEQLGNSNKIGRKLESGERLHGRRGEGRHKALSLGNRVDWQFTYRRADELYSFGITGTAGRSDPFYLTEETEAAADRATGCTVRITNIEKNLQRLPNPSTQRELASQFAPFLLRYPDRRLIFNGKPVNPRQVIDRRRTLRAFSVTHDGAQHEVKIQVIHWKPGQGRREVWLCSGATIPLHQISERALSAATDFTVFVRSELFEQLHEDNLLSNIEMSGDHERAAIVQKVRKKIRGYFRKLQQREADEAITRLKEEGSYPYGHEPKTEIDKVERQVFDLCAINVSRHLPNFTEGMDVHGRRLLLRMIQEALTQNPTSVGKIIREVCRLPEKDAQSFAKLLDDVPLSNVVHAARMVTERLNFLTFFEAIVYLNPFDRAIKERSELHRILAMNTWLFGEEYAVGTDDENLRAVLQQHVEILGRDHLQPELRDADLRELLKQFAKDRTKTPESLDRIPDLMLWRCFTERRPDEYEFLVIELKRPGVPVGREEIAQIEDYAKAVATTPFADFDRTNWVFVVVSDELDDRANDRAHQAGLPAFTILKRQEARYEVRAMPWNAIIRSARARHEHLRQWLNHSVAIEKAMEQATAAYEEYLPPTKLKIAQPGSRRKRA